MTQPPKLEKQPSQQYLKYLADLKKDKIPWFLNLILGFSLILNLGLMGLYVSQLFDTTSDTGLIVIQIILSLVIITTTFGFFYRKTWSWWLLLTAFLAEIMVTIVLFSLAPPSIRPDNTISLAVVVSTRLIAIFMLISPPVRRIFKISFR